MSHRAAKDFLYEQVARVGKALSSAKRLELIEVLCQGEKTVEQLAEATEISMKLASAHLKALRQAHLLHVRRDGRRVWYRLASEDVADFWVSLRGLAEEHLTSLQVALADLARTPDELCSLGREELLEQARRGLVTVIDVRPRAEFEAGHLPYARSMPLDDLERHMRELPADRPVVAYCRGPFCLMAHDAVDLLRRQGVQAWRWQDGVAEWRARGLPLSVD